MKPWNQKTTAEKTVEVLVKNAILALATSTWFMSQWHSIFNFDNVPGIWASLKMVAGIIGAHELLAWAPTILTYAKSNNDPAAIFTEDDAIAVAEEKAKQTVAAVQDVKEAAKQDKS